MKFNVVVYTVLLVLVILFTLELNRTGRCDDAGGRMEGGICYLPIISSGSAGKVRK